MNNCEKYFGLIEDLVEGEELDKRTAARVDSHIFACAECRKEYELLRREKELYAQYLYEFELPPDSRVNFQARLAEEREKTLVETFIPENLPRQRKRIFNFSFSPAFAMLAVLLFVYGISLILLKNAAVENGGDKNIAQTKTDETKPPLKSGSENKLPMVDWAAKNTGENDSAPENNKPMGKIQTLRARNNFPAGRKSLSAKSIKTRQKSVYTSEQKNQSNEIEPDEKQLSSSRRTKFVTEVAGQIEKVEMLLRSFRNARSTGSLEIFKIEYERGQARKLLEKNGQLRRDAENYGISYAEELLSRVEPYLLDIANLETNPAPGKVLDIKERVSSQNIIASLQVYSRDTAQ